MIDQASSLDHVERPQEALAQAWQALDRAPADLRAKRRVVRQLSHHPNLATADRKADLEQLLCDPDVEPDDIATSGWLLLLEEGTLVPGGDPAAMASAVDKNPLALRLLSEAPVASLKAELALTEVRRWLLLSDQWRKHSRLADALAAQVARNGGAWPFAEEESAVLDQSPGFASAYVRQRPAAARRARFDDAVTQAVADQYGRWPYPAWSRLTKPEPTTLPRYVEKLDGGRSSGLPVDAELLVAGCGTGREAARLAARFPDARVTAIDISAASLAYAAERCGGLGIDFRLLDLHEADRLGRRFDLIACSGVLHHLPDPEAGWAKLVEVLNPGGVMKVMVYSRVARLRVEAAKAHIADLRDQQVDDDLLRAVRRRLIDKAPGFVTDSFDFYSLDGVHDLLLNRHEDAFDVPRILRALERFRLDLLAFKLPERAEARYRREHPQDPLLRDVHAWTELEKTEPYLFARMYEFWCRAQA